MSDVHSILFCGRNLSVSVRFDVDCHRYYLFVEREGEKPAAYYDNDLVMIFRELGLRVLDVIG